MTDEEEGTNDRGRWVDLVDFACLVAGHPYPTREEAGFLLWEWTSYPFDGPERIWPQLLAVFEIKAGP